MFSSACSSKPHLAQPEYVIIGREAKTHSSEVSAENMSCLYCPVEMVNFSSKIWAFTWITPTKTIQIWIKFYLELEAKSMATADSLPKLLSKPFPIFSPLLRLAQIFRGILFSEKSWWLNIILKCIKVLHLYCISRCYYRRCLNKRSKLWEEFPSDFHPTVSKTLKSIA